MLRSSLRSLASPLTCATSASKGTGYQARSARASSSPSGASKTTGVPGRSAATSSRAVSGFMATSRSSSFLRATQPSFEARMVYQVGRPAMLDGKRFLPETGMPIWKRVRSSTALELCEPEPLTVATWMLKSLATAPAFWWAGWPASARASCGLMR